MEIDIVKPGMRFGHLEIIEQKGKGKERRSWLCRCDCGNLVVKGERRLFDIKGRNADKSCGCSKNTQDRKVVENLRVNSIWHSIIKRCNDETAINYDRYGAKGIKVCDEWLDSFSSFLEWSLANGYSDDLNLARIDVEKDYEPSNCRWSTVFAQMQNRGMLKNNTTGVNGVTYSESRGSYRAYIKRDGKYKYLGSFTTLEKAKEARQKAEDHYKEFGTIEDL
jgi:hypothetical protein